MATRSVETLVTGGKASAAPPLGPALGPLGVNIGQVVSEINKKTVDFAGMQVPVKVVVDQETKTFTIEIGTPPTSELLKKEAGIEKGSGNPLQDKVADLKMEQIIKVSKMKKEVLLGIDNFAKVKEVIGTCNSMGILVEGKQASQVIADINRGAFKDKILKGKTELSAEELKVLEQERKHLQEELERRKAEFDATAKRILAENEGKDNALIRAKLKEAGLPDALIDDVAPKAKRAGGDDKKPDAKAAAPAGAKK